MRSVDEEWSLPSRWTSDSQSIAESELGNYIRNCELNDFHRANTSSVNDSHRRRWTSSQNIRWIIFTEYYVFSEYFSPNNIRQTIRAKAYNCWNLISKIISSSASLDYNSNWVLFGISIDVFASLPANSIYFRIKITLIASILIATLKTTSSLRCLINRCFMWVVGRTVLNGVERYRSE